MFGAVRGWFDERVDQTTGRTLPILSLRLFIALIISLLTALAVGPVVAAIWAACAASADLATWLTTATPQNRLHRTIRHRLAYVAAVLWLNTVWSGLAVVLWNGATAAGHLAAICMISTQMLHAMTFANRAPALLFAIAGPPVAVLAGLTWFGVGEGLEARLMAVGAATIMVAYLAMSTRLAAVQANVAETGRSQAVAASEAKSAYLAFMSHELRTPLTGVLGMAEALQARPDGAERQAQLDVMVRSSRGMLSMLNNLLDIAKIEAGRFELERAPLGIRTELETVARLWSEAGKAKSVTLAWEIDEAADVTVSTDPTRLRQILNNLVGNAVKFTSQGAVTLSARLITREAREHLQLSIRDTGVGMSPEVAARLFQPFTQADATVARQYGGTGLGLAICRQLAEQMGGAISVESVLGQGSHFQVEIPVEICSPTEPARVATAQVELEGLRVLFVDDNPANRQVGLALLTAVGCDVTLAEDGLVAVEAAATQSPDIILMDLNMPRMDGFAALAAIRGAPATSHIPIVAISADVSDTANRETADAGFAALASKPIDLQALLATLVDVLAPAAAPVQGADSDSIAAA